MSIEIIDPSPGRAHSLEVTDAPSGGVMVRVIDSGLEEADTYGAREAWAGYLSQLKKQAEKGGP